jgi:predicted ATPase with chaperone activity
LPDAAVKESRDRVTTALINSGFNFTFGRTTINLAPADVKKEGPSFDLPIAVGMLAASEQLVTDQLENFVMAGELALDGSIRAIKGVLPIALRARLDGRTGILIPAGNSAEAALSHQHPASIPGCDVSKRKDGEALAESIAEGPDCSLTVSPSSNARESNAGSSVKIRVSMDLSLDCGHGGSSSR